MRSDLRDDVTRRCLWPLVCLVLGAAALGCDDCSKSSDCAAGKVCLSGKCQGGGSDGTDTSTGWLPTLTASDTGTGATETEPPTTTSDTGSGSETESGSDTVTSDTVSTGSESGSETSTGTSTGTDTVSDTDSTTETHPSCSDPVADCPTDLGSCQTYSCAKGYCEPVAVKDGQLCQDPTNECVRGLCLSGACSNLAPVSGQACAADDKPCTSDVCMAGVCSHLATPGVECDADNPCTNHLCTADGSCGVPLDGVPCTFDTDLCTRDVCQGGVCTGKPISEGASCDDGLWCNGVEVCVSGACTPTTPPCGAGGTCLHYACTEPAGPAIEGVCGELVQEDGIPCDDGVWCNGSDVCALGECVHGPVPCGATMSNLCEEEVCDEELQDCNVQTKLDETPCGDAVLCDGLELCVAGECLPGPPFCPVINDCQIEDCSENGGDPICADMTYAENGAICFSEDPCTGTGTHRCLEGICADAETPACLPAEQDGSFCTRYAGCGSGGGAAECIFIYSPTDTDSINDYPFPALEVGQVATSEFNTRGEPNDVQTYGASCPGTFTGGEAVYLLKVDSGKSYRVALVTDSMTGVEPLTLFLIRDACAPATTCLTTSSSGTLDFVAGGGTYYIAADGVNGNRGQGTVSLTEL